MKNNVINQPLTYSWRRNSTYALKRNSLKKNIVQTDVNFKDEAWLRFLGTLKRKQSRKEVCGNPKFKKLNEWIELFV